MCIALVGNQTSVHMQRWLEGLRLRGHRVIPIDLRSENRTFARGVRDMLSIRRAIRRVLELPRSLVSIHYAPNGALATGLRGLHPLVVSIWGSDATLEPHGILGRIRDIHRAQLIRSAEVRTVTSTYLADVVRRRFRANSMVVPFGVDLDRFRPSDRPSNGTTLRIGFVKWLEPKYGADVLLEALARLDLGRPVSATVVGDGRLSEVLRRRAAELKIETSVNFTGRLPHSAIPALLRDLDLLVQPSRSEEFGVSAAEACAAGLPVVSTRVGGVPEVIEDGVTGLLVEPDDPGALAAAIRRLASDGALRRRMGDAGRARMKALYSWEHSLERMEVAFRLALVRPSRSHGRGGRRTGRRPGA
jgi:glycosyltransferase involved in cell wall biosynthesis